jgi:hypothetical protein
MAASKDERNRILHLVESGQVSADEAAQLLDTIELEQERPGEHIRDRTIRVRATNINAKRQKVNVTATLPLSVIKVSLRLGSHLLPQLNNNALTDLLYAIETGATGRLLDLQDLEKGERVEVFVE